MKPPSDFFTDIYRYVGIRRLVMTRTRSPVSAAERWLGRWSEIAEPQEQWRRWEREIGPLPELARVQAESDRAADILARNFQTLFGWEIVPANQRAWIQPPMAPAKPSAKTKVPQSYLTLLFTTGRTVQRFLAESRERNDLIKVEKLQACLEEGFRTVKLSVIEQRVIGGIFNLLGDPVKVTKDGCVTIDGLSEWHAAMGLERKRTKRGKIEFDGREVQQVNKVIWELGEKSFKIVVKMETTPPGSREQKYDVLITQDSLFKVAYLFRGADGKMSRQLAAGSRPPDSIRPEKILIKPHPCLVAEYGRYFRLLPRDLYHEIRRLLPRRKYVKSHQLGFITWLHRHRPGRAVIETNKRSLAEEIGLGHLVRAGRWRELERVVSSDYRLARRLGYLQSYRENVPTQSGGVKDVLTLNPAMVLHASERKSGDQPSGRRLRD